MRPRRVGEGLERGVVGGRLEEVAIVWSSAAGEFEDVNSSELSSYSPAVLRRFASIAIVMISSWMAGSTDTSRRGGGTRSGHCLLLLPGSSPQAPFYHVYRLSFLNRSHDEIAC